MLRLRASDPSDPLLQRGGLPLFAIRNLEHLPVFEPNGGQVSAPGAAAVHRDDVIVHVEPEGGPMAGDDRGPDAATIRDLEPGAEARWRIDWLRLEGKVHHAIRGADP